MIVEWVRSVGPVLGLIALAHLTCMLLVATVEQRAPAREPVAGQRRLNLMVWFTALPGLLVGAPMLGAAVTTAISRSGGGWIVLPQSGWGVLVAFAVYALAMDLAEYVFHRAQHAIPWLWRLHALHHSDAAYNTTTTVRHFWADPLLKSVSVWLAVGLLIKPPVAAVLAYGALSLWNYVIHANIPLSLGRFAWALNTPHYHRRHHSASPEDFGSNYAALFPIWDLLTGAYRPPAAGHYARTGLPDGEQPRSLVEALTWPLVRRAHRDTGADALAA